MFKSQQARASMGDEWQKLTGYHIHKQYYFCLKGAIIYPNMIWPTWVKSFISHYHLLWFLQIPASEKSQHLRKVLVQTTTLIIPQSAWPVGLLGKLQNPTIPSLYSQRALPRTGKSTSHFILFHTIRACLKIWGNTGLPPLPWEQCFH